MNIPGVSVRCPALPAIPLLVSVLAIGCAGEPPGPLVDPPEREIGTALRLEPAEGASGHRLRVTYAPIPELADEPVLRLRARYRTAGDDPDADAARQVEAARLQPDGSGTFRGTVRVPDSVVYALLAVEDTTGSRIDTNGGRFWEHLRRTPEGRPSYDALVQKAHEHLRSDIIRTAEAARVLVELHPERAGGWLILSTAESAILPSTERERLNGVARQRVQHLHRRLRNLEDPGLDDMFATAALAMSAEEETIEEAWRRRISTDHPGSGVAIHFSLQGIDSRDAPGAYLEEAERLWSIANTDDVVSESWGYGAREILAERALSVVTRRVEDPDPGDVRRWADRYLRHARGDRRGATVGSRMATVEELEEQGLALLEEALDGWLEGTEARRPLGRTVPEHRRRELRASAHNLARLGRIRLGRGEVPGAIEVLETAASRAWYPYFRRTLADAHLSAGDTTEALAAWAYVHAYGAAPSFPDSIRSVVGGRIFDAEWDRAAEAGLTRLYGDVLAEARREPVSGRLELVSVDGEATSLDEARRDGPAVVVFWSTGCNPSMRAMPAVERLDAWLAERGGRLLAVTRDAPGDAFRATLQDEEVEVPVYHDVSGSVARAFRNAATPQFYVLDPSGRLRFAHGGTVDDARLWVRALEAERELLRGGAAPGR